MSAFDPKRTSRCAVLFSASRDVTTQALNFYRQRRYVPYRQRRYVPWSIPSYRLLLFCIADGKKQNLASYRKTARAFVVSNRQVAGLLPVQKAALNTDGQNDCCACYRNLREPLSYTQARRRLTVLRDHEDWGLRGSPARTAIR